ncbi:MAG: polyprenyl synthetase family protein [Acidobacteriota bacterium]
MSRLAEYFETVCREVDGVLETLLPQDPSENLYAAVRWSLLGGGKRFRPILLCAVGEAFACSRDKLLRSAAAFEMVHTYSLIHDDLPAMDDDDLRRGRATCHVKFDEATAILAGDVLHALAFGAIAEDAALAPNIRLKVMSELAAASVRMAEGQQMDLEAEGQPAEVERLEQIHTFKTGAMIESSARVGAIVAGVSDQEIKTVSAYASNLGLLFQVTDDLIDVTESTETLGKTAGKDEASQKATFPSLYGIDRTKELASEIHRKAVQSASRINGDASLLIELADLIRDRKS